jgi:hypothetical protein
MYELAIKVILVSMCVSFVSFNCVEHQSIVVHFSMCDTCNLHSSIQLVIVLISKFQQRALSGIYCKTLNIACIICWSLVQCK